MKLLFFVNQKLILNRMLDNLIKLNLQIDNFIIFFNNYFSHQMVYIGKTYNLWYTVIGQLEDMYNYNFPEHDKNNVGNINQI